MPAIPDSKAEKALAAIEEIRRAVLRWNRIDFNGQMRIIDANAPSHAKEKILLMSNKLDVLFSAKKHQKHGKGVAGSDFVQVQVLADLDRIERMVKGLEADPRPPEEGS